MTRFLIPATVLILLLPPGVGAQERTARWQRSGAPTEVPVTVFHSTQSANLPTAETLGRGEWLFEISHRFLPAVSDGAGALWGLDGPVYNRLALSYAVADNAMLGITRSNLQDNLDLSAKVRVLASRAGGIPVMAALNAGVAWNTETPAVFGIEDNERQAYAQLIVDALLGERLALGVTPTLLNNPRIADIDAETAFALGLSGQLYLSDQASLLAEWLVSEDRPDLGHDAGTFGIELETGGHFFKLILTNSARMNPTQFLGGTPFEFSAGEWRLGFNVTRVLKF
ncbi:MAG: DUF5777 family beta-barrel protein [Gemmatimonadota bacterium]|nr:DUF5777 family beta-barrel protein [Gemmatimonadota bacterium]MDH5758966.1 DUF5777 family beta-barrel protein [Gemmatimonadota bacterium]